MPIRLAEYLRKSRAEENMDTEQVLARHHEALREYVAARPELGKMLRNRPVFFTPHQTSYYQK